jgi:hypothetical protein
MLGGTTRRALTGREADKQYSAKVPAAFETPPEIFAQNFWKTSFCIARGCAEIQ